MKDDFSNLETGANCYVLNNQTSIYSYKGGVRSTYIQISGKWFKNAQSPYNTIPSNTLCWAYDDITQINSFSYMQPIYEIIAFSLAIFVCVVVFKLIGKLWRYKL